MGKWTSQHYDDVLGSKIKSLVCGSVMRAKLEQLEHTISYENFVEELDSGDAFTTSLIDLLVKETAERRQRKTTEEKRFIGQNTYDGLRRLASPSRIYRRARRTVPPPVRRSWHYLSLPPDDMEMEDDDDSADSVLEPASRTMEGTRMSTELWDAIGSHSTSLDWAGLRRLDAQERVRDRAVAHRRTSQPPSVTITLDSTSTANGPTFYDYDSAIGAIADTQAPPTPELVVPPNAPSLVSRLLREERLQQQQQQPTRSRTIDFADFTSRRRSSTRESASGDRDGEDAGTSSTGGNASTNNNTNSSTTPPARTNADASPAPSISTVLTFTSSLPGDTEQQQRQQRQHQQRMPQRIAQQHMRQETHRRQPQQHELSWGEMPTTVPARRFFPSMRRTEVWPSIVSERAGNSNSASTSNVGASSSTAAINTVTTSADNTDLVSRLDRRQNDAPSSPPPPPPLPSQLPLPSSPPPFPFPSFLSDSSGAPPPWSSTNSSSEQRDNVPRLRRGGVRPPESLFGWHTLQRGGAESRRRRDNIAGGTGVGNSSGNGGGDGSGVMHLEPYLFPPRPGSTWSSSDEE